MAKKRARSNGLRDYLTTTSRNSKVKFACIYPDMLTSEAGRELLNDKAKAFKLLMCCYLESYNPELMKAGYSAAHFHMNEGLYKKRYRLYSERDTIGFQRDMARLITWGFVDSVKSAYGLGGYQKNVYKLSQRWKTWSRENPPEVPEECKSTHMQIEESRAGK